MPPDDLKVQDLQELAVLSAEFESPQTAKSLLERLLQQPGGPFPKAAYHYGCLLLAEDIEGGLDHLVMAAETDQHMLEPAARAGYAYLFEKYGEERAQEWLEKIFYQDEEEEEIQ